MKVCGVCDGNGITLGAALYGGDMCHRCGGSGEVEDQPHSIEVYPVADNGFDNPLYIAVAHFTSKTVGLCDPVSKFTAEEIAYKSKLKMFVL